MAKTFKGSCFCGAVKFEVDGGPVMQGFCHCTDCRSWSGTPVTAYSLWPEGQIRVTAGEDGITRFDRDGKARRCSCSECGGALMAELYPAGLIDIYPHVLKDLPFEAAGHVFYRERVIDMPDGLPKFADLPEAAGGSGEMIQD